MTAPCWCFALVGPRAAGKTTVGRALARAVGWPLLDTDVGIALRVGQPAGAHLRDAGEAAFRRVEAAVCADGLRPGPPRVVALGGGAVTTAAVRRALGARGIGVVWLEAPPSVLVARASRTAGRRPPLTDLTPEAEVLHLVRQRETYYAAVAHLRISTNSLNVDACVALILDKMSVN